MYRNERKPQSEFLADDGSERLLVGTARVLWEHLFLLCGTSVILVLAALPFLFLASIGGWLYVWAPLILLESVCWMAASMIAHRVLDGLSTSPGILIGELRQRLRVALYLARCPPRRAPDCCWFSRCRTEPDRPGRWRLQSASG